MDGIVHCTMNVALSLLESSHYVVCFFVRIAVRIAVLTSAGLFLFIGKKVRRDFGDCKVCWTRLSLFEPLSSSVM